METNDDERFMRAAIAEAQAAEAREEVPVGAVIVCRNRIIARAHNLTETLRDVTAHARHMYARATFPHKSQIINHKKQA